MDLSASATSKLPRCETQHRISPDMLSLRQDLTAALGRFLGLTGTASLSTFSRLTGSVLGSESSRDGPIVHEAVSAWTGNDNAGGYRWIVKGKDDWLFRLMAEDGQGLY